MKNLRFTIYNLKLGVLFIAVFALFAANVSAVDVTVDTSKGRSAISPYIYGVNQDIAVDVKETARRLGGNRMTGYNWENNASNAGNDWQHSSDNYMVDSGNMTGDPDRTGGVITSFHEKSITMNAYSIITLPLAGYVSKDKGGPVPPSEKAPSERWAKVVTQKASALSLDPDKNDDFVYIDEEVNFLVNKFGKANTPTGIKGYSLDNEPDIWPGTHPRIHPDKTGAEEYIQKSIQTAEAVKNIDPYAEIYGPASYGYNGFKTFQDAPDFTKQRWVYGWYLAYYLEKMKDAEKKSGKRLLDVLDVHWYPEAQGAGKRIVFTQGNAGENAEERAQAPRSLWDPTYTESSWICSNGDCPIRLIPRLKEMIDKYYPGTKLSITEYEYGAGYHPSGGVATADVLGIFGKYGVYMANYWMVEWGAYALAAFRLYRNYDGAGSEYGTTNVKALSADVEKITTYASIDGKDDSKLHIILINKDISNTQTARVTITSKKAYKSVEAWGFDNSASQLTLREIPGGIKGNAFSAEMPPFSAYHVVLTAKEK